LLRVEFHCHTLYSPDSLTRPEALLAACARKKIDRVVITDHNTLRGALAAQALDPQRVIIGEEIQTSEGELLAAFVQEEVPKGLAPAEAIARLRQQGAFISVSHPLDTHRGWRLEALQEILPLVDALEVFNSRCVEAVFNTRAAAYARQHNLPGTVGSDAHTTRELGRSVLLLPDFDSADSLRQVLPQAKFQTRLSSPLIHLSSVYARERKRWGGVSR
jgi:hypothetical protein